MKAINKIFYITSVLFFLSFLSISTSAQNRKGGKKMYPKERVQKQTERMVKSLSLTEDQAAQVEAINLKYSKKVRVLRKAKKAAGRAEMKKIRNKQAEEIKSVLDDNQLVKFEEMKKKRRAQMQKRQGGNR